MLRSLGVPHVMDSRSLDFVRQVQQLTGGRGVDLVLNSLAGDFIGASVRCLGPQGRFLEIGKRDIWSEAQFAEVRPLGRYHAIDLAAMRNDAPAEAAALFTRILQRLERGEIRPLPLQAFDLTRAAEAFRFMAMARHTGKVVLTQPDGAAGSLHALDPRAAYLVTGGLSGLGLLTARHLVERGARHLTLVGRRAPSSAALAAFDGMRALGAQVVALQADMARPDEVRRVLDGIALATPLRGIVHCAGLLEDGALLQQRWERFVLPLGPKVDGAWALHALTRHRRLDFFVLYSSIASVLGSSGQGNHAAANSFIDLLAWQRRSAGLPALSIGWGAWSEVGAAADRGVDSSADARGIGTISPERGLAWLDMLMDGAAPHVAVFPVRWADFLARPGMDTPFVAHLLEASRGNAAAARTAAGAAPAVAAASILERLGEANAARRHELLLGFVGEQVARVIGAASGEAIDPRQPLNELGLDSLMAVELRNRLGSGLGLARSLPATLVFDHPTLEALAVHLASAVLPAQPQAALAAPAAAADAVGAIDDLSDEEIEKLFAKKMRRS
jgi:NAD(P)-dependent dehydrogenase (short-subunit alcohol dehydrogenase family)